MAPGPLRERLAYLDPFHRTEMSQQPARFHASLGLSTEGQCIGGSLVMSLAMCWTASVKKWLYNCQNAFKIKRFVGYIVLGSFCLIAITSGPPRRDCNAVLCCSNSPTRVFPPNHAVKRFCSSQNTHHYCSFQNSPDIISWAAHQRQHIAREAKKAGQQFQTRPSHR